MLHTHFLHHCRVFAGGDFQPETVVITNGGNMKCFKCVGAFVMLGLIGGFSAGYCIGKEYKLTILHTNDHHGHFQEFDPYPVSGVGGLAAQSTLVNTVRAEVEGGGGHVLLLSAGDVNTGIPESDLFDAEPDIKAMNMMGFDAMALGNHEFDNPLDVLKKQQGWAQFPLLAANVVQKISGELLVDPYVIKEIDGLRVAVLGLLTDQMPSMVLADYVKDLEFRGVIATAQKYIPQLKEEADLIVALTHIGFYGEDSSRTGDIQLAMAVPELDVIVGGHTHTKLEEPYVVGKTLIVQADGYSEYVGRLNLVVDSDTDSVTAHSYQLLPVNAKKTVKYNGKKYYSYVGTGYVEDQEILDAMNPYIEGADELLNKPVGIAAVELTGGKSVSRTRETNLGNLITDGMRAKIGADIAFQNGGGIRAGIAPGQITYRDLLTVQPFGNTLTEIEMTGAQIIDVLDAAAARVGTGGFMQVSGIEVTYNVGTGKAEKVMIDGEAIDQEKIYKVVTNNFLAAGGDGYALLATLAKYDTGYVDAEVTMEYIQKIGEVNPALENRITVLR